MQSEPQQRPLKYGFSVDASYDRKSRVVGIGMVVQCTARPGRRGPVLNRYSEGYTDVPPGCMEKLAVLRALEILDAHRLARKAARDSGAVAAHPMFEQQDTLS